MFSFTKSILIFVSGPEALFNDLILALAHGSQINQLMY